MQGKLVINDFLYINSSNLVLGLYQENKHNFSSFLLLLILLFFLVYHIEILYFLSIKDNIADMNEILYFGPYFINNRSILEKLDSIVQF